LSGRSDGEPERNDFDVPEKGRSRNRALGGGPAITTSRIRDKIKNESAPVAVNRNLPCCDSYRRRCPSGANGLERTNYREQFAADRTDTGGNNADRRHTAETFWLLAISINRPGDENAQDGLRRLARRQQIFFVAGRFPRRESGCLCAEPETFPGTKVIVGNQGETE